MTLTPFEDRQQDFEPEVLKDRWTLPTELDEFMVWLDSSGLGEDDEARVEAFMKLPIAKEMPQSLRDALRVQVLT
jgi:hypothetical protein